MEHLAIIKGFQDNYIWLHGRPLTILSNNKPAIAKAKSQEKGILDQLQYLLSTSGAHLEYNKGSNQVIPDFMSRFKAPRVDHGNVCSVDQMPYLEHIKEKQHEDIGTRKTIQHLVDGNPVTESEYKDFAKQLFVSQGILFRRFEGTEKVVIPASHAEEFITETHLDPIINHMGAQKIIGKLQDYAYIKFHSKLAHQVVKNCGRCIQNRILPTSEQHAPLQDPDYPKCFASYWHVGHTGAITQGDKTFYIWGGIDAFSKHLVTRVSETKTAESAFKFFWEKILFRFRVPDKITSDQG